MSAYYAPESSAIFYSQMARAVSMFSDTLTSVAGGSATTARWMDGSCESPYPGSPPVAKRCARLEAEVVQLRKRLNTEMRLLPIVQSTDAGGLTCEFMFPADKTPRRSSAIASRTLEPLPVSRSERDVVEAGDRARTETPRNVDSGGVEAAWVTIFDADVEDAKVFASPSVDVVFQQGGAPLSDLLPSPVVQDGVEQDEYDFPVQDYVGNMKGREQHEVVQRETGGDENKDEGTKSIPGDVTDDATDEIECVGVHSMTPYSSTPVFDLACQESESNHGSFLKDVTIVLRQTGCEEELPSSIGTLIKWSHDTPPATSPVAGGYFDVSASLTTRGVRSRRNRSALEVPRLVLTDVFNLGISGAYRSAVYSPVTSGSLPWFVRAMHSARTPRRFVVAQPPPRLLLAPSSPSPSHPTSLSVHSPAQVITAPRRLPDVYTSSQASSSSPLLPGAWQWSTSCTTPTAVCDDLRSTMNDILNFLLLGALLSYLLLTPAVSLLLFLWTLWGLTISPASATTTSAYSRLRPLVTSSSAPILQRSFPAQPARSLLVPRSPLARLCSLYGAQARLPLN